MVVARRKHSTSWVVLGRLAEASIFPKLLSGGIELVRRHFQDVSLLLLQLLSVKVAQEHVLGLLAILILIERPIAVLGCLMHWPLIDTRPPPLAAAHLH